jgi:glycosyltransferase involved in cell wall biosynthesis
MPARNVLPYLDASIESILGQSFGDFEFVIRDDGSTDGTTEALRAWAKRDSRIRLSEGRQLGLAGSSNWIVRQARAPLIARMDADDLARPDRLERQVALMREAPDVALTGSLWDTIDSAGRQVRGIDFWRIVRHSCFVPFPHTSVMFRRAVFDAVGGYRPQCDFWEDLDFFLRMAGRGRVMVIADNLVSHRESASSSRLAPADEERIEAAVDRMYACLSVYADGAGYEPIVAGATQGQAARRLRPMSFVSINSNRLWAGERPRIAGKLLSRGRLGFDLQTVQALAWSALAYLSPAALRALLKGLMHFRNLSVKGRVERGSAYEWQPQRRFRAREGEDRAALPDRAAMEGTASL